MNELKRVIKNAIYKKQDAVILGEKRVKVRKLTPVLWRELFDAIETLPGLIVQVALAKNENYYETVLVACDIAMEEVVRVVSILSELDEDYVRKNAGINEIVNYLVKTAQKNDFAAVVKNVNSLLPIKTNE